MKHYLFVGPSALDIQSEIAELCQDIIIMPPIARGDLGKLQQDSPAIISICDGVFHSYPAVGHAEIIHSMQCGSEVWGLSSMGAIRASELAHLGMHGFGKIFEEFVSDTDLPDDAVAVLHDFNPPFSLYSEPLVHLREYIQELEKQGVLLGTEAKVIRHQLTHTWFGNRTVEFAQTLLKATAPHSVCAATELALEFQRFRTKTSDLKNFLQQRPWESI